MAYNGSGTFNLYAGNPVVTATTISSTWANNTLSDVATGLSNVICRDGQSTTTSSIGFAAGIAVTGGIARFPAGTVGAPGIYLSTDSTTGLYRSALNNLDVAVAGANALNFASGIITVGASTNLALGANYISRAGTAAGLSLDASNNASFSGSITGGGAKPFRSQQTGNIWMVGAVSSASSFGIEENGVGTALTISSGGNTTLSGTLTVSGASISTGSTTALSLATSGGTQFQILQQATAVNYLTAQGAAAGSGPVLSTAGSGTNVLMALRTKGTGGFYFQTNDTGSGGDTQVVVTNTTSATRYITLTGSNGGNPTIGVSAGVLAISADMQFSSTPAAIYTGATNSTLKITGDNSATTGGGICLFGSTHATLANIVSLRVTDAEKARITAGGYFKASNDGTYIGSTAVYHELCNTDGTEAIARFEHSHASTPYGISIQFSGASPDNNTQWFLVASDGATTRMYCYSDGDFANHDGTYGTISDLRFKPEASIRAANSQWEDVKALADLMINYETTFSPGKKLLGWGAQQVQTVSPGVVHSCKWSGEDALFTDDMTILKKGFKALGEAMKRIEALEARL